ncbi:uncharacterized protein RAG0_08919 [Rhynchosporium agropyri]|uniref:Uncharacterized protein n=1 Tax=Rhynchosporium agropyri TaxID=914238 RepID=A0A1E1KT12_9HELO|nr:uncharacterized protein RAG0_08919 [Rhynchosporium agropyri]
MMTTDAMHLWTLITTALETRSCQSSSQKSLHNDACTTGGELWVQPHRTGIMISGPTNYRKPDFSRQHGCIKHKHLASFTEQSAGQLFPSSQALVILNSRQGRGRAAISHSNWWAGGRSRLRGVFSGIDYSGMRPQGIHTPEINPATRSTVLSAHLNQDV